MNPVYSTNATYNSLIRQVAFCKIQGYNTVSRYTSGGPSLFTSGDVWIGAGLSKTLFGNGSACGMCMEILGADNFSEGNWNLTSFKHARHTNRSFIAMVFDECTDPICTTFDGFLDFDVYSPEPPVPYGNAYNVHWRPIPCPVFYENGEIKHKLEYLICNPTTCNVNDSDEVRPLYEDFNPSFFGIIVRNSRLPITAVKLLGYDLQYITGFGWTWNRADPYPSKENFVLKITASDGSTITEVLDYDRVMTTQSRKGYHGGVIIQGHKQV